MNTETSIDEHFNFSPFCRNIDETDTGNENAAKELIFELQVALNESEECLKTAHQLARKKANEVMVWVLSNKDRLWSPELPNSVPIAYGLKSFSFSSDALRRACNEVLYECVKRKLHVPLLAFDGQWYSLMVRDSEGKPLTQLQLQKDVWKEATSTNKARIVECFRRVNAVKIEKDFDKCSGFMVKREITGLVVSSTDTGFLTVRTNQNKKYWTKKPSCGNDQIDGQDNRGNLESSVDLTDWIPDNVLKAIEDSGDNELLNTIQDISKDITCLLTTERSAEHDSNEWGDEEQLESRNDAAGEISNIELNQRQDTVTYELQDNNIHILLKCVQQGSKKEKIIKMTPNELKDILNDPVKLSKLTKIELHTIINTLKNTFGFSEIAFSKSWSKGKLINSLSKSIGNGTEVPEKRKKKDKDIEVPSLKSLALKLLKSRAVPKAILNIAYAQYLFPSRLNEWQSNSHIGGTCIIEGIDGEVEWYSQPEKNETTGELLCKCLDSHHLLTNLRIKTSTTGIHNIKSTAWKTVAKSHETKLTPAMVEDLVDKQSNAYAQTHFSEDVEKKMIDNGDIQEAQFCRLVRRWYEAEDQPALSALDRIMRWLDFKKYIAVYPTHEGSADKPDCIPPESSSQLLPMSNITPVDHSFDHSERRRTKARRKLGMITSNLDAPPNGTRPMRQEFHKCDESKILPSKKVAFLSDLL